MNTTLHTGGFRRAGSISAFYLGGSYVVAMIYYLVVIQYPTITDPTEKMTLLVDRQSTLHVMQLLTYVLFGVALSVLVLTLFDRLGPRTRLATVLGLLWAGLLMASGMVYIVGMAAVVDIAATQPELATTTWQAIEPVALGLGGSGGELLGGLWVLLVSVAALRQGGFPRWLSLWGVLAGSVGLTSVVPGLATIGPVFGLLQLVWFIAVGVTLLHDTGNPDTRSLSSVSSTSDRPIPKSADRL